MVPLKESVLVQLKLKKKSEEKRKSFLKKKKKATMIKKCENQ